MNTEKWVGASMFVVQIDRRHRGTSLDNNNGIGEGYCARGSHYYILRKLDSTTLQAHLVAYIGLTVAMTEQPAETCFPWVHNVSISNV